MQAAAAIRILRRELRGGLAGFRVFVACLALGVASVAAIGTVRTSIEVGLSEEGAAILGGDAQAEFSYRRANPDETGWLEGRSEAVSEAIEFRSMAAAAEAGSELRRSLTEVKAVDGLYPLYGTVAIEPTIKLREALAGRGGIPGAVMQPSLADRLGIEIGDTFTLGSQPFRLAAFLMREPDSVGSGPLPGPKTIVLLKDLEGSGLLGPGSLYSSKYRLKLSESIDLAQLRIDAQAQFAERGVQWARSEGRQPRH